MDVNSMVKNLADRSAGNFNMANSLADAKSAYDTGVADLSDYADSSRNFMMQYALNEQANAREIEMWKMQNAYNTPAAQMQRLIDAGLNPMLAYQQVTSGNATSAPGTHVPNVKLTKDQDNMNKLQGIMAVFQAVNGMVNQMMQTVEQSYDLGIKRNEKAWSDLDFAAGSRMLNGFGEGRDAKVSFPNIIVQGPNGEHNSTFQSSLDPFADDFNPLGYRVLNRLGVANYVPRITSANASAHYSNSRTNFQNYYNEHILPLEKEFKEGKVDMQKFQKSMIEYQDEVLEMIPPEYRAFLIPILLYLRPLINTSMRFN